MGIFERYLSVWVGVSIVTGVILGYLFPVLFNQVADIEFASVNIVIASCIWVMVYPMMVQVDFSSIKNLGERPKGLILTLSLIHI